jgi:hypothetical protein
MERFVEVCQGVNARRDLMPEMALGRVFSHSQSDLRPSPPLRPGGWPCWLVLHEPWRRHADWRNPWPAADWSFGSAVPGQVRTNSGRGRPEDNAGGGIHARRPQGSPPVEEVESGAARFSTDTFRSGIVRALRQLACASVSEIFAEYRCRADIHAVAERLCSGQSIRKVSA